MLIKHHDTYNSNPRFDQPPELFLSDDSHAVPLGSKPPDLHQLEPASLSSHLQGVGATTHQDVGGGTGAGLEPGSRFPGRRDGFLPGALEESGERDAPTLEAPDPAGLHFLRPVLECRDQFVGRLVALGPCAETAVNDFLQMITAGKRAYVLAPHRALHVAPEQHRDQLAHLIHIVTLLPLPDPAPGDFGRCLEGIERVRGDTAPARLVGGDAEVAELERLVLADEDVEGREIAVHRLAAVHDIEGPQDRGDLVADEPLRLRAALPQPRREVPVLGVFHDQAIAGPSRFGFDKPVKDAEGPGLAIEQLGEVGLAQPAGDRMADLDADLARERARR